MCTKTKMKVCFMTQATAILSVSIVTQVISFFIPLWVYVEIDGRNISGEINNMTKNTYYYNFNEATYTDGYDDDEITRTSLNMTSLNVTEHYANRSYAIWYIGTCIDGICYTDLYPEERNCTYNIQSYYEPGYNFSWVDSRIPFSRQKRFQIYVTIALVVSIVAVILTCNQKRRYKRENIESVSKGCHSVRIMITLGLILASGILLWIPSLAYSDVNKKLFALEDQEIFEGVDNKSVTIYTPIALIFAQISLISLSLAFFSIFVAYLIKRSENQANRSVSLALIPLNHGIARRSVPIPSTVYQCEGEHSSFAHTDNIFVSSFPFENTVHNGDQAANNTGMFEPPPPSYEETMRLYDEKEDFRKDRRNT